MDFVLDRACLTDITLRGNEEHVMRKSPDRFTKTRLYV
jgi:hypothetical protein